MDIIESILLAANNGARKTHIMYGCNLSFKQLHIYLAFLRERGLVMPVRIENGEKNNSFAYATTRKGRAFLQSYRNLRALLSTGKFED